MKKKVVVGLSGGVDSSVTAALLLEKGYDVIGVTAQIWTGNEKTALEIEDAKKIASLLNIPHHIIDLQKEFNENVINYFVNEYLKGRTPNPCIWCNRYIKFEALLHKATEIGADFIATGHYARTGFNEKYNRRVLRKSVSTRKDQTYVLYRLKNESIQKLLFPLGDYDKPQIRSMAQKFGLVNANKKESQEICFIPDDDYARFVSKGHRIPKGNFIDKNGKILGRHKGIIHYTIGQRKGLGITFGKPMYVTKIDHLSNTVTLGQEGEQYKKRLVASNVNFIAFDKLDKSIIADVKIRYASLAVEATISPLDGNRVEVIFNTPQRSITPGQSAVFYDDDIVLGGGIIDMSE